jgi:hypothetical protein
MYIFNYMQIPWAVLSEFHIDAPVPLIHQENNSPDEIMRIWITKIMALQRYLFTELSYYGEFLDAAAVKWNKR